MKQGNGNFSMSLNFLRDCIMLFLANDSSDGTLVFSILFSTTRSKESRWQLWCLLLSIALMSAFTFPVVVTGILCIWKYVNSSIPKQQIKAWFGLSRWRTLIWIENMWVFFSNALHSMHSNLSGPGPLRRKRTVHLPIQFISSSFETTWGVPHVTHTVPNEYIWRQQTYNRTRHLRPIESCVYSNVCILTCYIYIYSHAKFNNTEIDPHYDLLTFLYLFTIISFLCVIYLTSILSWNVETFYISLFYPWI